MEVTTATPIDYGPVTLGRISEGESSTNKFPVIFSGFIIVAGLMMNILIILVIVVPRDYKNTRHWYVLNLAIANSLLLVALVVSLQQTNAGLWTLGGPACAVFQCGLHVNFYAGSLLLAVMGFDLFVDIALPTSTSWKTIRSRTGSNSLAGAAWAIAIVATIPITANSYVNEGMCDFSFDSVHPDCKAMGIRSASRCEVFKNSAIFSEDGSWLDDAYLEDLYYNLSTSDSFREYDGSSDYNFYEYDESKDSCFSEVTNEYATWIIINFLISFALPLSVMTCSFCGILYQFYRRSGQTSRSPATHSENNTLYENSNEENRHVRAVSFVASLVAAFVICLTPLHGLMLSRIRGIHLRRDSCYKLHNAVILLSHSNNFLNPLLYMLIGIDFRVKLKILVSRICGKTFPNSPDSTGKNDVADLTNRVQLQDSKNEVPLSTISSKTADADIEAQIEEVKVESS